MEAMLKAVEDLRATLGDGTYRGMPLADLFGPTRAGGWRACWRFDSDCHALMGGFIASEPFIELAKRHPEVEFRPLNQMVEVLPRDGYRQRRNGPWFGLELRPRGIPEDEESWPTAAELARW